ncbi:hypothetical protein AALO_G00266540 [Alosa alosa]|uniref:Uncharacterized protein n=1 Tax=Alosa alosa TaxID=278164 RepID=A0AAV6FPI4_9TELE|nr:hypothetical protein AALO_G00266540 [Alosa alosa]
MYRTVAASSASILKRLARPEDNRRAAVALTLNAVVSGAEWTAPCWAGRKLSLTMLYCLLALVTLVLLGADARRGETTFGNNNNNGNPLDNDKWMSTVSQYDKDRYWNKFRDVSNGLIR